MGIMFHLLILCLGLTSMQASHVRKGDPIVTVSEGKLKGSIGNHYDGSTYYSFKGIRYAQPPIGNLRFKPPLPPQPWEGIYNATEHGSICTQYDADNNQVVGDEDCLFLNIYTKSLNPQSKIPVMVYIHGGSYSSGSGNSDTYTPDHLIRHGVILVTLNYRLEVLGFLSVDTPGVPGNAGMKDQVAALRWINRNIAKFGGDPNCVTIFGESSGGAAVNFHMLSPISKGLFHKVIAQSGVFTEESEIGRGAKARAFRAGKVLGKETDNPEELIQFLRTLPAADLTNLTDRTLTEDERHRGLPTHFAPVVEKFSNENSFLSEEPMDMLLAGKIHKVPMMVGHNSGEGILLVTDQLQRADFNNRNPQYFVSREISTRVPERKTMEFGKRIKKFYFGDKLISNETAQDIVDMTTDLYFAYDAHRFTYLYASLRQPIYMYRFSAETDLNVIKNYSGHKYLKGACHADDLFYLFYNNFNKEALQEQPKLRDLVYRLTKLWADFAKTGDPTPGDAAVKWKPYTTTGKEFLDIDEVFTPGNYANRHRIEFLSSIYREAGRPHIH